MLFFLKENIMEKNILDISEDILQNITGGCLECVYNVNAIRTLTALAKSYDRKSEQNGQAITRANTGDDAISQRFTQLLNLSNAAEARQRIDRLRQIIA